MENIHSPPIVNFKRFDRAEPLAQLPVEVYKKMSNDQRYLYRIVNSLRTGHFSNDLRRLKIGALNHSRWVTTASRICLLYASTEKPSETLKILTSYIVNVYAPTWFQIKKNELAIDGPKNLFFLIKKCSLVEDDMAKAMVRKCIQRNAFFAHSENMLLAQLSSKTKSERIDAVNKILNIRERVPSNYLRRFEVPEINFEAKFWTDVAVLDVTKMTEPPFTLNMNEDELLRFVQNPLKMSKFKCHTQMAERAVKEVTRVSSKVIDHDERTAMVKATLLNRAKHPKLDSAKDHLPRSYTSLQPKI